MRKQNQWAVRANFGGRTGIVTFGVYNTRQQARLAQRTVRTEVDRTVRVQKVAR